MTVPSGTQALSPELRPLTDEEKNTLDMLIVFYSQIMATTDPEKFIENAQATMQVEGLLTRLKNTGMVSPVLSTLERVLAR